MFHHENLTDAPYIVIAYYYFIDIPNPDEEVAIHKEFLQHCDVTCRVYISHDGINAQMSFSKNDAKLYMEWLHSRPGFGSVQFKLQGSTQQVFARVTVKNKPLVAFGRDISLEERGQHVSPAEWKKMLENEKDAILIDVRNTYEWKVGHFEGAEPVPYDSFREFQQYAVDLKKRLENTPQKKVMMYCTGGIRCEYFSALLKQEGINDVYQLDGGVINYGEKEGAAKWQGSLFVFDDRLTVPVGEGSSEVIGTCKRCGVQSDRFYNCANMDCNELFLSCEACLEEFSGCCQESCLEAPRLRPFQYAHTPFRRWYNYAKTKKELLALNIKGSKYNVDDASKTESVLRDEQEAL